MKGDAEPEYLPANERCAFHQVIFAHGYFSSALHEIAHWCIAGSARRLLPDYGYWYAPDGRDAQQQRAFEQVEVLPQAIEWAFCMACRYPFSISIDNLHGDAGEADEFTAAVADQLAQLLTQGFPQRAQIFIDKLQQQ